MDLKRDYSTAWVKIDDEVTVKLRLITETINERASDDIKDDADVVGLLKSLFNYCVVDWDGVTANGKKAACNEKNKLELVENNVQFAQRVVAAAHAPSWFTDNQEDLKKNLIELYTINTNGGKTAQD